MNRTTRWASIDAYIAAAPPDRRALLEELRATIRAAAPEAEETISYGMPAFAQNGTLVYFAALKNHIGFYPTPSAMKAFAKELSKFVTGDGSVQFPLDKALPLALVRKLTGGPRTTPLGSSLQVAG